MSWAAVINDISSVLKRATATQIPFWALDKKTDVSVDRNLEHLKKKNWKKPTIYSVGIMRKTAEYKGSDTFCSVKTLIFSLLELSELLIWWLTQKCGVVLSLWNKKVRSSLACWHLPSSPPVTSQSDYKTFFLYCLSLCSNLGSDCSFGQYLV